MLCVVQGPLTEDIEKLSKPLKRASEIIWTER